MALKNKLSLLTPQAHLGRFNPEKILYVDGINQLIDQRRKNQGRGDIRAKPWTFGFEPTYRCQLACTFCSHYKRNGSRKDLPDKAIDSVQRTLTSGDIGAVVWGGGGEPTFWLNRSENRKESVRYLADMMGAITESGAHQALISNGLMLNDPAIRAAFIRNFTYGQISFHASTPEKYKEITQRDLFHRALEAIGITLAERESLTPSLSIRTVLTEGNAYEMLNILHTFIDYLGVDFVSMRKSADYESAVGGINLAITQDGSRNIDEFILSHRSEIKKYNAKSNIMSLLLPGMQSQIHDCYSDITPEKCWVSEFGLRCVIEPEGYIAPCTQFVGHDADRYAIGQVDGSKRFEDFWGSPRHREVIGNLTDTMKSGHPSCSLCSQQKYNKVIQFVLDNPGIKIRDTFDEQVKLDDHGHFI